MTKLAAIVCPVCGEQALKQLAHVKRAEDRRRPVYCGRKCFGAARRRRTPEERAEYMRLYRERHREKARQRAREWRAGEGRDRVIASQRASYERNREDNLERMKRYREETRAERMAATKAWLRANPDKARLYEAKRIISAATGMRIAEVPSDLAEAKSLQLAILRWVRQVERDSGRHAEREDAGTAAEAEGCQSGGAETPHRPTTRTIP